MLVDLQNTTTATLVKEMDRLREVGGVVALGRVLTLIVSTDADRAESVIQAANAASREHPCRVIVYAAGDPNAVTTLDAQIRVGGDAGASDVVVLYGHGANATESESLVSALLLPDAPIVVWWTHQIPEEPAASPLGRIAHRRIMDTSVGHDVVGSLRKLRKGYSAGDTDLAWTRLTGWRIQLAAIFDDVDASTVRSVTVEGAVDSASTILLAAWLTYRFQVPVTMARTPGQGIRSVRFVRAEGDIVLARPAGQAVASLYQQNRPVQRISLPRRSAQDCLTEELRRMGPDDIFGEVLQCGLPRTDLKVVAPSER
ncbi:glucose-6-phosphate dehydrogenase assembly protein OpcA [Citricoccus muralis]|uniref:Glucose-6-phosphate dehydrogenase assembly protein OpcA n=1 Tax=Citricoccus muralis TaxID=169134 RepID=A0ABY8H2Q9_9MICC|nr:glucose-6-phosphate dehydrogenase assembly protein OpcA [Citricoccus muralis]WFP15301.1 glucose-6-phosphate dehydrogenase assembly protein OpcA [Citricoccus muralis]